MSTKKRSATLRWSRVPRASGLAGIGQGPRGWYLWWGPNRIATVSVPFKRIGSRETDGWYFVARSDELGVPLRNTCGERGKPPEVARKDCVDYVLGCLTVSMPEYTFKPPTRCPGSEDF